MPIKTTSADPLGDRMKRDYENRTRYYLPRRTYTLIRIDGKSFHQYTKGCERPYDRDLMADMDATALALCKNCDGARLAFVQSDEISVLLSDFANQHSEAWFDGNLQKIASVTASIATAHFNAARARRSIDHNLVAYFDSRAWTIPSASEVVQYFLWRQNDATRNSISMTAQTHFPHSRLQGKKSDALQEMLWQEHGINWNDLPAGFKRGRIVEPIETNKKVAYQDNRSGEWCEADAVSRRVWRINETPPIFGQDHDWLRERIPLHNGFD